MSALFSGNDLHGKACIKDKIIFPKFHSPYFSPMASAVVDAVFPTVHFFSTREDGSEILNNRLRRLGKQRVTFIHREGEEFCELRVHTISSRFFIGRKMGHSFVQRITT
ncbi:unnamed protein product [Caenorhabditis brenneri]